MIFAYQLALKMVTEIISLLFGLLYCFTDFLAPFESQISLYFLCPNVYSYERNFLVFLAPLTATPMSQIKPHLIKVVFLGPFTKYKWKIQEFSSDFSFRGSSCCACNRTQCVPDVGPTFVPLSCEKSLRQAEKVKRIPTHPMKNKLQEPTKNRLKRQSPNHLTKANQKTVKDSLPDLTKNKVEPLIIYR